MLRERGEGERERETDRDRDGKRKSQVVIFSSLTCEAWENVRPLLHFFFFKVEISSRTLIPLFRPGPVHSGSAR